MQTVLRRYVAILAIALLTLAPAAWADQTSTLERIAKSGRLVLGTAGNMPPMTRQLRSGEFVGLDIDLASMMAKLMKAELVIKVMPLDKLVAALKAGEVDIVISNLTMNPERNMDVAFVGPYLVSGKCLVSKSPSLAQAKEVAKVTNDIAVLKGSTSETWAKAFMPKANLVLVDSDDAGAQLIVEDKVGALLSEYPTCALLTNSHQEDGFVSVFSTLTYEPIGIALPGGDAHMINWTQNFMQRMKATGHLQMLADRWLGDLKRLQKVEVGQ